MRERRRLTMIKAFRIDERLIHGQVITTWLKILGVTHLIVADDDVAKDEVRQKTLKMVLPSDLKCLIKSVDAAARALKDPRCESMKILLITGSPQSALKLLEANVDIPEINLANYGSITKPDVKNKVSISKMVYLDKDDVAATNKLIESGKAVFTQKTPSDIRKIINKIF
jgi:mannose/fructose/N-acetylgalactosamine-specific phosphotransferase system component IIB